MKLLSTCACTVCKAVVLIMIMTMTTLQDSRAQERSIAFEGIENARDMGSLVMQDGSTVSTGRLIRSGNLYKATDSDIRRLKEEYQLAHVIDFRFEQEAGSAPDRTIDGVSYTHLSTLPKSLIAGFSTTRPDTAKIDMSNLAEVMLKFSFSPSAQAMAQKLYPAIVNDAKSQRYYGRFLDLVLKADGGVLWHCSQGKDRAGWASAFLLAALGASREVIVADFDLSNQSYASQVEAMSAKVREMGGGNKELAFIRAMVGVSRENFEATLDMIDSKYGSLSDYLENQLGFSKEKQKILRKKYLIRKQQ